MATKKQKQEEAPKTGVSWKETVAQAKDRPDIYPKLDFGDGKKGEEVSRDVEFLEAEPREITYEPKFPNDPGMAHAINVLWLNPEKGRPEPRSIVIPANPSHGLTAGIAKLFKRHGTLKGVRATLKTRQYENKTYGETRGYDVFETAAEDASGLPDS